MKKIFVIEDDKDIADFLEIALCERYTVLAKRNGTNLLPVLTQFMPDLILIDNQIGQRNASEILDEIRSADYSLKIPLILFSGHPDIAAIAIKLKADAYLAKPFNLVDLYSCIAAVLEKNDVIFSPVAFNAVGNVAQTD
ncbi:hypothetical protein A0256_20140 [Mucilaginibacter sp. PAMC 26640]|nr:hypothetical protein A0256_20140 [Mucilaginibacter sp. PAMC 26640]